MLPWIKITTDLPDKWQVLAVRRALKVRTAYEVVGMLVKLWSHFEGHTDDGKLPRLTPDDVDLLIGRKGFARALVEVGWLKFPEGGGVEVPAYDEYMGAAARRREEEAERKRLQREREAAARDTHGTVAEPAPAQAGQPAGPQPDTNGTPGGTSSGQAPGQPRDKCGTSAEHDAGQVRDTSGTEPGPKRERKKKSQSENLSVAALPDAGAGGAASEPGAGTVADPKPVVLPANLESPEFRAAWGEWVAQRRAKKIKAYTPEGAQALLNKLAEHGPVAAVAAIRESIVQGWQGLFPDRHVPRDRAAPRTGPDLPRAEPRKETPEELVARLRREKAPPAPKPPPTAADAPARDAPEPPPCTSRSSAPTGTPSGSPPTPAPSG